MKREGTRCKDGRRDRSAYADTLMQLKREHKWSESLDQLKEMRHNGITPTLDMLMDVVYTCRFTGQREHATTLADEIRTTYDFDEQTWNLLILSCLPNPSDARKGTRTSSKDASHRTCPSCGVEVWSRKTICYNCRTIVPIVGDLPQLAVAAPTRPGPGAGKIDRGIVTALDLVSETIERNAAPSSKAMFYLASACFGEGQLKALIRLTERLWRSELPFAVDKPFFKFMIPACLMDPSRDVRAHARECYERSCASQKATLSCEERLKMATQALVSGEIAFAQQLLIDALELPEAQRLKTFSTVAKGNNERVLHLAEHALRVVDMTLNAHRRRERWGDAYAVVDAVQACGLLACGAEFPKNHSIFHNSLNACEKMGEVDRALKLFRTIEAVTKPSEHHLSLVLTACAKGRRIDEALAIFERHASGRNNQWVYTSIIQACANAGKWKRAMEFYLELEEKASVDQGFKPEAVTFNAILDAIAPAYSRVRQEPIDDVQPSPAQGDAEAEQRVSFAKFVWSRAMECSVYGDSFWTQKNGGRHHRFDLHNMSPGAGEMAVRWWLNELSEKLRDVDQLDRKPTLCLVTGRGKTRPGHQSSDIQEVTEKLLLELGVPTIVPLDDAKASQFAGAVYIDSEYLALMLKHHRRDWFYA